MAWIGQSDLPFEAFEQEMIDPLKGVPLSELESFVANLLLGATSSEPIKQAEIIAAVASKLEMTVSERMIRIVVRSLRRDRAFPICSRKGKPAGYWWGRTEPELEEFIRVWRAQFLDEAQTLSIMIKANFPRLAGQMKLELEE